MSRFIKFPTHVRPSRVTPDVVRVEKVSRSPLTNMQQIARRGNPAWHYTIEYKDLSEDEREVVQAFVAKTEGGFAKFKFQDPAYYDVNSYVPTSFLDVFSGHGSFETTAGSQDTWVNSHFEGSARYASHITEDRDLRLSWRVLQPAGLLFNATGNGDGFLNNLKPGAAYVQRVKFFQNPIRVAANIVLAVGSGTGSAAFGGGPETRVFSSGNVTVPFWTSTHSLWVSVNNRTSQNYRVGDYWHLSDYRLSRCALVCNSENLLTMSNQFDDDWTLAQASVVSGYGSDPLGGAASWLLLVNSQNNVHGIRQTVTKQSTPDIYTLSVYARSPFGLNAQLRLVNGFNNSSVVFDLTSGSVLSSASSGSGFERAHGAIYDVGSGWFRLSLTSTVNDASTVECNILVASGDSTVFAGSTSEGLEIFGAQFRKFPFMGHYCETTTTALVGTGYQSGRHLIVDGLDPGQRIRRNTRVEVVNRFYNNGSGHFERSELKRVTDEVTAHAEGWAILPIDPPIRNKPIPGKSITLGTNYTMHNPVIFDQPELTARLVPGTVQEIEKPLKLYDVTFEILEDLTE